MNNILLKILCSFYIVLTVSFPLKAGVTSDTSRLLADNPDNVRVSSTVTLFKEVNVAYPAGLQTNMVESLDYVQKYCNKKREYLIHTYQKGKNLFPKVAAILKKYDLPQELKVLIALESGFEPNAVSRAGAVGYWQMMDEAAKDYGLLIKGKKYDERKNFTKSTIAAAKYLRNSWENLHNDLLLAVASYNCGLGKVRRAMKKTGRNVPGFWDIKKYLPSETRLYVMNFIALNVVFANYDKFVTKTMVFTPKQIEIPLLQDATKLHSAAAMD